MLFDPSSIEKRPVIHAPVYGPIAPPGSAAFAFLTRFPHRRKEFIREEFEDGPDPTSRVVDQEDAERMAEEGVELCDRPSRYGSRNVYVRWKDGLITHLDMQIFNRRDDPDIVEFLKSTPQENLALEWIPECYDYRVHKYDGLESVSTVAPWETMARELARVLAGKLSLEHAAPTTRFLAQHPDGTFGGVSRRDGGVSR